MFPPIRLVCLFIALFASALHATAGFELLHSFTKTGQSPIGDLCEGSDGEFFGIATRGEIFKVTADGTRSVVHSFSENEAYYSYLPNAGLVRGADGSFYGFADAGGLFHSGTFFCVTASLGRVHELPCCQVQVQANREAVLHE